MEKRLFGQIKRTDKIQYYGAGVLQGAPQTEQNSMFTKAEILCTATKQRVTLGDWGEYYSFVKIDGNGFYLSKKTVAELVN